MNLGLRIAVAALLAQSAFAAPTVTIKRLPTGLTNAQFVQKLTPIFEASKREHASQETAAKTQLSNALAAIASENKALNAALAKDPRYNAMLDQARRISAGGGTAATRAAQLKALAGANRVIFSDALRTSGINASTLQSKVGGGLTVSPDLTFRLKGATLRKTGPLSTTSSAATPAPADLTLFPGYDFESTDTDNGGIAYQAADATARPETGIALMQTSIVGLAGAASGEVRVGEEFPIPAGVKRLEVTVTAKTNYSGSALAVLGAGITCTDASIVLFTGDFDHFIDRDSTFDCVSAAIGWFAEMSGSESRNFVLTGNVPAGTTSAILFGESFSDSTAGGAPGYADGETKVEIDKIRVHYVMN